MNRVLILLLVVIGLVVGGATVASSDAPPPTISQLKAKIRQQANVISDKNDTIANLRDEIDTQDGVIADQNDTITRLRARDPLDAVLARSDDGKWAAVRAIWLAFPTQDPSQLCGYDRSSVPGDGIGLTLTSYTFYRWQGC